MGYNPKEILHENSVPLLILQNGVKMHVNEILNDKLSQQDTHTTT